MSKSLREPIFTLTTHRIEALGDGVFAIVMTLLILEIHVPQSHGGGGLASALAAMWPKFLCYGISFVTLGVYWVAHHLHFYTIKRANRALLWINILFLMCVSVVPFSTALIGEHYQERTAVVFFGVNMILISLVLYLHWAYATRGHRLVDPEITPRFVTSVKHVILMGPAVYIIAIGSSFLNTKISLALYLLVNLLYIIPGGAHLYLKHRPANS